MTAPPTSPTGDDHRPAVAAWSAECGTRLHTIRVGRGWQRRELAAAAGTTAATIHRIESGQLNPRDRLRLAIAGALDVPVDAIWQYPPSTHPTTDPGRRAT